MSNKTTKTTRNTKSKTDGYILRKCKGDKKGLYLFSYIGELLPTQLVDLPECALKFDTVEGAESLFGGKMVRNEWVILRRVITERRTVTLTPVDTKKTRTSKTSKKETKR